MSKIYVSIHSNVPAEPRLAHPVAKSGCTKSVRAPYIRYRVYPVYLLHDTSSAGLSKWGALIASRTVVHIFSRLVSNIKSVKHTTQNTSHNQAGIDTLQEQLDQGSRILDFFHYWTPWFDLVPNLVLCVPVAIVVPCRQRQPSLECEEVKQPKFDQEAAAAYLVRMFVYWHFCS